MLLLASLMSLVKTHCNLPGSYTSATTFQDGTGSSGPSTAKTTSEPRDAAKSLRMLNPRLPSTCERSFGKLLLLAAAQVRMSSITCPGFVIVNPVTAVACGVTYSSAAIGDGLASQTKIPLRSAGKASLACDSVICHAS